MEKIISTGLAIFLTCNAVLAQPSGKTDYKTCNPAIWPSELNTIRFENYHPEVLEVLRTPEEKGLVGHYKWQGELYIKKAESIIKYEKKANAICDTRTLVDPLQFPLRMYKGLKIHMNR